MEVSLCVKLAKKFARSDVNAAPSLAKKMDLAKLAPPALEIRARSVISVPAVLDLVRVMVVATVFVKVKNGWSFAVFAPMVDAVVVDVAAPASLAMKPMSSK